MPRDFDGVFDALMRRTSFRVDSQRTLDRVSMFGGGRHVIVKRDRFDPNRPTHADDATVNGSGELVAVEGNLTPCQGAGKRAEHSTGYCRDDMVERRGDRRSFTGSVVGA